MFDEYRNRAITIRPRGGLGNQLFIYAAGWNLAIRLNVPLLIDTVWFRGQTKRLFELDPLIRRSSPTQEIIPHRFSDQMTSFFGLQFLKIEERMLGMRSSGFVERSFRFDARVKTVNPGTTLIGYFQSNKYFSDNSEKISLKIHSYISEVARSTDTTYITPDSKIPRIAVHIRRGDYQRKKESCHHGVLGADYYHEAFRLLRLEVGDFVVVPFSDDIQAAVAMLKSIHDRVQIPTQRRMPGAWEDLAHMSSLDGIVTANSSFSWWAAWLLGREGKPCLVPDPWFRTDKMDTGDLLPSEWKKVAHEWIT